MSILDQIVKPTLLLDEEAAKHNISRMADKAKEAGVMLRPHFKTHQSHEIGTWFRQTGTRAITVSSLDMAEYFAADGWDDITLAFPVNLRQAGALNALASRVRLGLLAESPAVIQALAGHLTHPVDLWVKIDTGSGRTGIAWDQTESARACVHEALAHPHLRLRGLLTHAGATYSAAGLPAVAATARQSLARLRTLRSNLDESNARNLQISIGDTPGCSLLTEFPGADEIRPGNYVFFDAKHASSGVCAWEDVAVALACPVVALHPARQEAVIYGGAIHLSMDTIPHAGTRIYGLVSLQASPRGRWQPPLAGAWVARLSQEHGIVHLPSAAFETLREGDLLFVLPAHSCLTAQCMGSYLTLSGRQITMMRF